MLGQIKPWKSALDFPRAVGEPIPQALERLHSAETCLSIPTLSWNDLSPSPKSMGSL